MTLQEKLQTFAFKHKFLKSKGTLSLALILNRIFQEKTFPLKESDFVTEKKGQVKGLSGEAAQKILSEYGITRVLAKEGGRTSRGSMANMQSYIHFLNNLYHEDSSFDLKEIEQWWIQQVRSYFAAFPLRIKLDQALSLQSSIRGLMAEALKRQQDSTGTMVVGAVMQHLVGAKLQVLYPEKAIDHHGFSVADQPTKRTGDFFINGSVIHVTTAPTERLLHVCKENLRAGDTPIIITTGKGVISAENLMEATALIGRVEILELEQFLVTNLSEWSSFNPADRKVALLRLLDSYNQIVELCETDPSLKIELA